MKCLILLFLALLSPSAALADGHRQLRLQVWNVENLFDTINDLRTADDDFLPDGPYRWNSQRYWRKQGALARTILDAGGLGGVDVVGLCEVEGAGVVGDLCRRTRLAAIGYDYVATESADRRGVDVALMFRRATFRLVDHRSYSVPYDSLRERPTRDVLHCTGVIPSGDTLDILVVHFPSRRGGEKASRPYRLRAAGVVGDVCSRLLRERQRPAVIVMGDCNDQPHDASLQHIAALGFSNLAADAVAEGSVSAGTGERRGEGDISDVRGTYYFQREWERIDNVLINTEAAERFRVAPCRIFAPEYLLEADADGFAMPFRTYRGPIYHGGVSDHLPLVFDLHY